MAEGQRKIALEMVQTAGTDRQCVTFILREENCLRTLSRRTQKWNFVVTLQPILQRAKLTREFRHRVHFQLLSHFRKA